MVLFTEKICLRRFCFAGGSSVGSEVGNDRRAFIVIWLSSAPKEQVIRQEESSSSRRSTREPFLSQCMVFAYKV
jgi:hypothetical protein